MPKILITNPIHADVRARLEAVGGCATTQPWTPAHWGAAGRVMGFRPTVSTRLQRGVVAWAGFDGYDVALRRGLDEHRAGPARRRGNGHWSGDLAGAQCPPG
ncbi:MAG: hypothetical protein IPO43_20905 [Rhodoferax sp.]|nr:hypothetical protein [Rhodoferax sp.]